MCFFLQNHCALLRRSSQSQDNASTEFSMNFWDVCGNKYIDDANLWFNGEAASYVETPQGAHVSCIEKIGNGAYLSLVLHPDGSNHVFVSSQQGKIWLADVPDEGSNGVLGVVESEPFLDLTDAVAFDCGLGLMGMAFHLNFVNNGRFFLSFNCNKMKQPGCSGRCSCNTDVNYDPAKLGADNRFHPRQYPTIIAENTVNASLAKSANSAEARRILTMGLPSSRGLAGQIGWVSIPHGSKWFT